MTNRLKGLIQSMLFGTNKVSSHRLHMKSDSLGLIFYSSENEVAELKRGVGSNEALMQLVLLQMLLESGYAEELPNGYRLPSEVVVKLDTDQTEILSLPGKFDGAFSSQIKGHSKKSSFGVSLNIKAGSEEYPFQRKGPFLIFGDQQYLLTPSEFLALEAIELHQGLEPEERTESANLKLIAVLQSSEAGGMNVDLNHFDNLDVFTPDSIGVVGTRLPDGSLELTPSFGDGSSPEQINNRLAQLDFKNAEGALRVDNRLIVLEENKFSAIKEVIGNKRIPADKVEEFINTPMAFLDASLVNLDLGFSIRVSGIGKMQHIDFGEGRAKKLDWFQSESCHKTPLEIVKHIDCYEDLFEAEKKISEARNQGSSSVEYQGEQFDISSSEEVRMALSSAKENIEAPKNNKTEPDKPQEETETVTVLLKETEEVNTEITKKLDTSSQVSEPDWSLLLRTPYPHQKEGIKWMLGLLSVALKGDQNDLYRVQGALLADDMGLGKTFMTLVMLSEYFEVQRNNNCTEKPVLVVSPLSLLENWEQEVESTFKQNPFRDIKVLQSGRDLNEFRIQGAQRESQQHSSLLDSEGRADQATIKYALKIGPEAGVSRLDMGRRLVLTTYQTLRDYQFSLCMVDWGVVVFDEAQNIKNPNTLQTRAAKGLKADFKLLATGTPVENSLADFWCLMDTAQAGLLGNWQQFRDQWIKPINEASEDDKDRIRVSIGSSLRETVGQFMLRRIKEDQLQGLPRKFIRSGISRENNAEHQVISELAKIMSGLQLDSYNNVLSDYRRRKAVEDMQGQALAALQQLRKVSLHPRLDEFLSYEDGKEIQTIMSESVKLKILFEQLEDIRNKREKVIIFMMTKKLQMLLKIWLDKLFGINIHIINGDTAAVQKKKDTLTRKRMIDDFESVDGFNVIIMSPIAAGVGLTVVGANHVIHLERHWNPAKEAQATDRVYRIGQKKDVYVHLPVALHPELDSFDVHLDQLLSNKLQLKDAVVTPEIVSDKELISSMGL